jgi:hypothetical protein
MQNQEIKQSNHLIEKKAKMGAIHLIWLLWYGSPRSDNEMETMTQILLLLEKQPPTTNPYWTLSDLKNNMKKTYLDIQKAIWYMEENKVIETNKNWIKKQGNKRFIKMTFKGNDFLGSCRLLAKKTITELNGMKKKEE